MYVQHDGVAMVAPVPPVIADVFMVHMETTLFNRLIEMCVCGYVNGTDTLMTLSF
jgi:hypothetical protein